MLVERGSERLFYLFIYLFIFIIFICLFLYLFYYLFIIFIIIIIFGYYTWYKKLSKCPYYADLKYMLFSILLAVVERTTRFYVLCSVWLMNIISPLNLHESLVNVLYALPYWYCFLPNKTWTYQVKIRVLELNGITMIKANTFALEWSP